LPEEGKLVIYSTDVEQGQARIVAAFSASFPKIKPATFVSGRRGVTTLVS
jgi:hypothetical protein